jgi:hypothetical protein
MRAAIRTLIGLLILTENAVIFRVLIIVFARQGIHKIGITA